MMVVRGSCLWDVSSQDYHNREKRETTYLELEEVLGIKTSDIKSEVLDLNKKATRPRNVQSKQHKIWPKL